MGPRRTKSSGTDRIPGIEQLLRRQVRSVSAKAVETGEVSAEQMESLARLKELIELDRALAPQRHKRWPVLATLVLALITASFLFFDRIPSADVEMNMKVSEVAFRLARPHRLWDTMAVTEAGVSGVEHVELPLSAGGTGPDNGEFQLKTVPNGKQPGSANLAPLELPAGALVRIQKTSVPRQYRLSFQAKGVEVRIDAAGSVSILSSGASHARFDFAIPQSIGSTSGTNEVDLDFSPGQTMLGKFARAVPIAALSVSRVEQYSDGDRHVARHVSTLLSGSTYFEALGTESAMRAAEEVSVESAVGEIRTLTLEDDDIALQFHGRVTGLSTGFEENVRNIMPTRLDWLRAQQGLPLLWGCAAYLFTMAAAIMRWWGIDL